MQKIIDNSYFDWSKNRKPAVVSRGLASLVLNQLKTGSSSQPASRSHCIWPSGLDNIDSRYLTRKVWSR